MVSNGGRRVKYGDRDKGTNLSIKHYVPDPMLGREIIPGNVMNKCPEVRKLREWTQLQDTLS